MKKFKEEQVIDSKSLVRIQYDTHNREQEHTHDFVELIYVINGDVVHRVDDEFYKLERGGMVFINIGQTHSYFSHGNIEFVNIIIKSGFFERKRGEIVDFFDYIKVQGLNVEHKNIKQFVMFDKEECAQVENIISFMNYEYVNRKDNYNVIISNLFKTLTLVLIRKMSEQQLESTKMNIKEFINLRSLDNININEIADFFGYNYSYLSRKFKKENNQTITSYIQENRAKSAVILLEGTDYSIEVISNLIGYNDVKQIYKLLKKTYGLTPKQIRENSKKGKVEKYEHK